MINRIRITGAICAVSIGLLALSSPAAAYIGPGLGLGVIASIFGAIAAFLMMVAGLIWYPVKVMLRKRKEKKTAAGGTAANAAAVSATEQKSETPAS